MSLADNSGTISLARKIVPRLGFGAMRLTGRGIWGEPTNRDECIAVLRRAVEQGVRFIDTADAYGPFVSEDIIREALHPYGDVLVATKVGLTRNGPDVIDVPGGTKRLGPAAWPPVGRPEYLRQSVLMSMRRLAVEHIDLLQLHRIDPRIPLADQVGELKELQDEGKIVDIGLSQVTTDQLDEARSIADIVSVQSRFNVNDRTAQDVLDVCRQDRIVFVPWAPVAQGGLGSQGALKDVAARHGATVGQVAIAWLLATFDLMAPIPGTSQQTHLDENLAAADISLDADDIAALNAPPSNDAARGEAQ